MSLRYFEGSTCVGHCAGSVTYQLGSRSEAGTILTITKELHSETQSGVHPVIGFVVIIDKMQANCHGGESDSTFRINLNVDEVNISVREDNKDGDNFLESRDCMLLANQRAQNCSNDQ